MVQGAASRMFDWQDLRATVDVCYLGTGHCTKLASSWGLRSKSHTAETQVLHAVCSLPSSTSGRPIACTHLRVEQLLQVQGPQRKNWAHRKPGQCIMCEAVS